MLYRHKNRESKTTPCLLFSYGFNHKPALGDLHPVHTGFFNKVTAKSIAPVQMLSHVVIGTVPACVLH